MQLKNIGFLINQLDASQISYLLTANLNDLLNNTYLYNATVFYQYINKPLIIPQFPKMNYQHAWGYEGILIATNIETAKILSNCLRATKKYFYVFDLEWLYQPKLNFEELKNVYQNPSIELIARNKSHADILTRIWKKPVTIIEDFNNEQFVKLINS